MTISGSQAKGAHGGHQSAIGLRLYRQFCESRASIQIIFTSGYPPDMWPDLATLHEISGDAIRDLQKPFLPKELLDKTKELIGVSNPITSQRTLAAVR